MLVVSPRPLEGFLGPLRCGPKYPVGTYERGNRREYVCEAYVQKRELRQDGSLALTFCSLGAWCLTWQLARERTRRHKHVDINIPATLFPLALIS
jgi:hypothetical protein